MRPNWIGIGHSSEPAEQKSEKNSILERQNSGHLSDKVLTNFSDISNSGWTFERQVYPI